MDDVTKCDVYTKLLNSLSKNGQLEAPITKPTYQNQIKLIKNDLVSKVQSDQETALQMIQILIDNNVHNIQSDLVSILSDDSIHQKLKNSILDSINSYVTDLIKSSNVTDLASLYAVWQVYDVQKFTAILRKLCCSQDCKKFFIAVLVPTILNTKNIGDTSKVSCIDLGLQFASVIPIATLSNEEYNTFVAGVNDYIKSISELRDSNFPYWHKLWMFVVRFLGKKLHHSMNLMNKLLRVVEHAFRNSSYEQRLRGYDCWKELIDNVSLDNQHIISDKQIRLLLTPLRAKFSRQEAVIIKRFEVFVYLIEKLQDKAVLVLKEFLEFCFGEVGENTDPNKAGQGKSLSELWLRSAKVLLAILGHSHGKNEHCLEADSDLNLKLPVLNGTNISGNHCHIINSIAECCKLLKQVELGQNRITVLKCFWKSLLNIIFDEKVTQKENCLEVLGKVLDNLLEDNDPYCHSIAAIIFKESVKIDKPQALNLILNNLDRFLNLIFAVSLGKDSYVEVEKFLAMVGNLNSTKESSKVLSHIFHSFEKYKTAETNVDFVADLWIFMANNLEVYEEKSPLDYLIWPVLHAHKLTESAKEVSLYTHYQYQLSKIVEKSDDLHLALFKQFEKTLKNNPLLLKNVLSLITMFTPKTSHKDITNITLDILALMLMVPATSDSTNHRQSIELYLQKLYEADITTNHDPDTIKKLCACVEHLLKIKHYNILTPVEKVLASLPDNIRWIHGKYLTLDFLVDVFEKETDLKATEKIHKIIELLRNVKNPESTKDITSIMPLGGRSAKIAKLVKQIPQSPNKRSNSPSTLRLFGKDVETHSPLKVVGSKLTNVVKTSTPKMSPMSTPKKKEKPFIDDESNSKFVLIESVVKLDKNQLTEHQKESLKKRREDIPALYQDLSQSVSQSLDSNSVANSTKPSEAEEFKKPTDVEVRHFNLKAIEKSAGEAESKTTDIKEDYTMKAEDKNKETEKNKKNKIESELKKLSMDIVGAQAFISAGSKRSRRDKKDDKKTSPEGKKRKLSLGPKLKNAEKGDSSSTEPNLQKSETDVETTSGPPSESKKDVQKGGLKRRSLVAKRAAVNKTEKDDDANVEATASKDVKKLPIKDDSKKVVIMTGVENKNVTENQVESEMSKQAKDEDINMSVDSNGSGAEMKNALTYEEKNNTTSNKDVADTNIVEVKADKECTKSSEVPVQIEKIRRNRRSFALPEQEVRKSRRKSLPTKKLVQSQRSKKSPFKFPEKKTKVSEKSLLNKSLSKTPPSQSELFKQTQSEISTEPNDTDAIKDAAVESTEPPAVVLMDETTLGNEFSESETVPNKENDTVESSDKIKHNGLDESSRLSKNIKESVEIPLETQSIVVKPCENGFGPAKKRKRLSSIEDDDDIIESSQESSVTNINTSKLRLSVSKRSSILIEKSTHQEVKENSGSSVMDSKEDVSEETFIAPTNHSTDTELVNSVDSPNQSKKVEEMLCNELKVDEENDETKMTKTRASLQLKKLETSAVRNLRGRSKRIENKEQSTHVVDTSAIMGEDEQMDISGDSTIQLQDASPKRRGGRKAKTHLDDTVVIAHDKEIDISVDSSAKSNSDGSPHEEAKRLGRTTTKHLDDTTISGQEMEINIGGGNSPANPILDSSLHEETKTRGRRTNNDSAITGQDKESDSSGDASAKYIPESSPPEETKRRGRSLKKQLDNSALTLDDNKEVELTTRKGRRTSPKKSDKEDMIQCIVGQLKKQIFQDKSTGLDVSTQDTKQRTQSQDTQTQDTESLGIDAGEIVLQLELPQKPFMTSSDKIIARMDTASLSLVDMDELKGFDLSAEEKLRRDINRTVVEDKTITDNNVNTISETEDVFAETEKDKSDVEKLIDSADVIGSSENIESARTRDSDEITNTEELVRKLVDRDIEVTMDEDHSSPVRKRMPEINLGTPVSSPGPFELSLPSSPITGETPTRTNEFLNDTSDISPIGSKSSTDKSSSDDEFVEERKLVPVALKFEQEDGENDHKQKSPEKGDDAPQKIDETSPEKAEKEVEIIALGSPPKGDSKPVKDALTSLEKSGRFNWMKQQSSPASHRFFNRRKTGLNMSPSASRIKKLMSNVKPLSQGEYADQISQEDILTFTREVPSPLAVPRSSILKRKHSDTPEEGLSPCAKRKRVNFSDPCTTSKKVFIKDGGAANSGPSQCLFSLTTDDDELDKQFLEVLASNMAAETPQSSEMDTSSIETEPSLQINNPMLLRDDVPIYPELVDCEENVSVISRKLTGPMFVNALLSKLNSRNVRTIGDLAKLSEVSIARLPFKTPMVGSVYKALDNYYHKNFKSKATAAVAEKVEVVAVNGERESELAEEKRTSSSSVPELILERPDVKLEMTKVLERARSENLSTETICSLVFESTDQKHVLTWAKKHFDLQAKDMMPEEKDIPKIVQHITETLGVPKLLEMLISINTKSLTPNEQKQILTLVKTHLNIGAKDLVDDKDFGDVVQHIMEVLGLQKFFEMLIKPIESSQEIQAWLKSRFKLDRVEENNFPKVVKHIIETVGLPRVFEILTESLESSEDESVYFDCMIKHSIEKRPLSSLIEKRSVQELKSAMWENVDNEIYSRKDLLDVCFLPLIKTLDMKPFFDKLTVVELADVVVARLRVENYDDFTKRLLAKCMPVEDVKRAVLSNYPISELTTNILERGTAKEIISSFTYMFLSADKEVEDLVQIFRLVSNCLVGKVPPSKLMELSIECLKMIPIKD